LNIEQEEFEVWLTKFMAFQKRCREFCSRPVPDEVTELKFESQLLEPLQLDAEQFAADAISYYYEAKNLTMKKLDFKEFAKSALDSMGKAGSYRQLWAKESAERLAKVVVSRGFRVAQHLELNGMP
jgi:hypothetical protein